MDEIVHFGHQQIFENATTYTCLLFLSGKGKESLRVTYVSSIESWRSGAKGEPIRINSEDVPASEWHFSTIEVTALLRKLSLRSSSLADSTERIFQGIKTSADKIYILDEIDRNRSKVMAYSRQLDIAVELEPTLLHPLIKGGDSKRYCLKRTDRLILFPYAKDSQGRNRLIPEPEFRSSYPLTWEYLALNKKYLMGREHGKMKKKGWYGYVYPKALDVMALRKIFTPDIAPRSSFSYDSTGEVFFTGGVSGGYGIIPQQFINTLYLLGLLNSSVLEWCVKKTATVMRGGYYSFESRFIKDLPIRTIDFSNRAEKSRHDRIVKLVESLQEMNARIGEIRTPAERERMQRRIDAADREIDSIVYELYDLTPEEIAVVEGAAGNAV